MVRVSVKTVHRLVGWLFMQASRAIPNVTRFLIPLAEERIKQGQDAKKKELVRFKQEE
jgi:hypothetical protein